MDRSAKQKEFEARYPRDYSKRSTSGPKRGLSGPWLQSWCRSAERAQERRHEEANERSGADRSGRREPDSGSDR